MGVLVVIGLIAGVIWFVFFAKERTGAVVNTLFVIFIFGGGGLALLASGQYRLVALGAICYALWTGYQTVLWFRQPGIPAAEFEPRAGVPELPPEPRSTVAFTGDRSTPKGQPSSAESDAWFDAAYLRHQSMRPQYLGPPEVQSDAAKQALQSGDTGVAVIFAQRSLNTLEDLYVLGRMTQRRPSSADCRLTDMFDDCMRAAIREGRADPVRTVAEAAKRNLRRCAEASVEAGIRDVPFARASTRLDEQFPDLGESASF